MNIFVTGATGMLGKSLANSLNLIGHKIFSISRQVLQKSEGITFYNGNLSNFGEVSKWLDGLEPDLIIHCAANTDIKECESNYSLAFNSNVIITQYLAEYAKTRSLRLIYISTDSVFDGNGRRPYKETDKPNPQNNYSKTKLLGEEICLSVNENLVLRGNILGYRENFKKPAFIDWLVGNLKSGNSINLFNDVICNPLHVDDLSLLLIKIIETNLNGLYHFGSDKGISKYDLGILFCEFSGLDRSLVKSISVNEVTAFTKRPLYTVLDCNHLRENLPYDIPSNEITIKKLMTNSLLN